MSNNPSDLSAITSAHFLVDENLVGLSEPDENKRKGP